MKAWIYDKGTGELLWQVESGPSQIAAQETEAYGVLADEDADPALHYVVAENRADRPVTGLPVRAVIPAATEWHVEGVPPQTRVLIDGEPIEDGIVGPDGFTIRFDYAEDYQLDLLPPFPYRGGSCLVTVE